LLQLSRLFTVLNNLNIDFNNILILSSLLIPNLVNVTLPFIIIFGLSIGFIKLDKDKEIIAIYSLGLSINQIIKPLIFISFFFVLFYLLLNLFISPLVYEKYKKGEFELRNLIDLNDINNSNFIKLNDNLILDFDKKNNEYKDVFIRHNGINENIIYSKKALIINNYNEYIFDLSDGFKLSFLETGIEKLEFKNYKITFPISIKNQYNNYDKNTLTIINLIKNKDLKNILERIFDTIILVIIIFYFYINNIKINNFSLKKIFSYLLISIGIMIFHNMIKNMNIEINYYLLLNLINFLIISFYIFLNRNKVL